MIYSSQYLSATIEDAGVLLELDTSSTPNFVEWLKIALLDTHVTLEQKTNTRLMIKTQNDPTPIIEFLMCCAKGLAHSQRSRLRTLCHPSLNTEAIAILQHGISCTIYKSAEHGATEDECYTSSDIPIDEHL